MADRNVEISISAKSLNVDREFAKVASLAQSTARKIDGSFSGIGTSLKSSFAGLAASLSAGAFVGIVKSAIDAQDALNDLSAKTGVSVSDLSGLSLAARQSGSDLESVAESVNKLSVNIGKDPEKFRAIGISAKDPIEALKQLADIFVAIKDPQERAAFGAAALGESWAGAAQLLAAGGAEIGRMVDRGKQLSGVTEYTAAQADQLNDKLEELRASSQGFANSLVGELLPSLGDTARAMYDLAKRGHPLLALLRGFAGMGKLPFDLALGNIDMSKAGQVKDLQIELEKIGQTQAQLQKNRFWAADPESVKTMDELTKRSTVLKNQIEALNKFGTEKAGAPAAAATKPPAGLRAFIGGGGKSGGASSGRTKAAAAEDRLGAFIDDLDVKALRDYESALESFARIGRDATVANADLTDSQKRYYDLVTSADWSKYSADQQEQIRMAFELADAAEINADAQKKAFDSIKESADGGKDKFAELQQAIEGWGKSSAKAIADFAVTGKASFSDMAESIISDLIEMAAYQNVTKPLFESAGSFFAGLFGNAKGNVYSSPSLSAYSGGVYRSPRLFAFARGAGVFGEAGPEAIMPLSRTSDGKLGVRAQGGGGVTVNVINNASGTKATQQTRQDTGGKTIVDVVIEQVRNAMIGDIGKGGALAGALESQYALNRSAGAWR